MAVSAKAMFFLACTGIFSVKVRFGVEVSAGFSGQWI